MSTKKRDKTKKDEREETGLIDDVDLQQVSGGVGSDSEEERNMAWADAAVETGKASVAAAAEASGVPFKRKRRR